MVKVNFAIHMEENILVLGKMGKNGLGTYTYSDGRVSTGNYKNGKKNGNVKIECPNGDIYEGDFINGSPSGKFTYTNTIGEISEIDFKRLKNPSMTKE